MKQELLYMYNVCRREEHRRVLRHVSLNLYEGEILGILGKNDSSLSGLRDVLSGIHRIDSGTLWFDGHPVVFKDMTEARQQGIYLIQKESTLFPNLSIAENIGGIHPFTWSHFVVHRRRQEREIREFLEENEIPIRLNDRIDQLSLFDRCQVEIARAIYHQARVILFFQVGQEFSTEESALFRILLEKLRMLGIAVIRMGTSLYEQMASTDRIVVVAEGKIAGILDRSAYDSRTIQTMLMKKTPDRERPVRQKADYTPAFRTRDLRVAGAPLSLDLEVRKGEIVGVYADSRSVDALFEGMSGMRAMEGELWVNGRWIDGPQWKNPADFGVGCVSHALGQNLDFPNLSVYENLMMRNYRNHVRAGVLDWRILKFIADENARFHKIPTNQTMTQLRQDSHLRSKMFSLIAWMAARPVMMVLRTVLETADESEREHLYELLDLCRQKGIAVLYCLNQEREAVRLCDRVYDPQGMLGQTERSGINVR